MGIKNRASNSGRRLHWLGIDPKIHLRSPRVAALAWLMPEKAPSDSAKMLLCPMPGIVTSIIVQVGDEVQDGQPLATVEP